MRSGFSIGAVPASSIIFIYPFPPFLIFFIIIVPVALLRSAHFFILKVHFFTSIALHALRFPFFVAVLSAPL